MKKLKLTAIIFFANIVLRAIGILEKIIIQLKKRFIIQQQNKETK